MSKNERKKLGLVSIKYSAIEEKDWVKTKDFLTNFFENQGLDAYILVRIFGRDEIWVVLSFTDFNSIERIEEEPFVIYTALFSGGLPLDEKIVGDILTKKFPVAYLLFRKRRISLGDIKSSIASAGGNSFLIAEVSHPKGFSHFASVTVKTRQIKKLNDVVYGAMKGINCKDWECVLGVKHSWSMVGRQVKTKPETGSEIAEIIQNWRKAAENGKLEDWEIDEIFRRFDVWLPKPKKRK